MVPPAGDLDRRRDGEEDQRSGQKHKVRIVLVWKIFGELWSTLSRSLLGLFTLVVFTHSNTL